MTKQLPKGTWVGYVLVPIFLGMGSCGSPRTALEKKYDKGWKEIMQSQEWQNSFTASVDTKPIKNAGFYVIATDVEIGGEEDVLGREYSRDFRKKYHSLVLRSYFKVITQAERMNSRLEQEYAFFKKGISLEKTENAHSSKERDLREQRYLAHKTMLEGLRSWNVFNENRTADLDFFKRENIGDVHKMYEQGKADDALIRFLIYRLADLYHREDYAME